MIQRDKNIKDTHMPIYSNSFKIDCKTFVDFGKQTRRASFVNNKRTRFDSPAVRPKSKTTRGNSKMKTITNLNRNNTSYIEMINDDIQFGENQNKNYFKRNVSSKSKIRAKSADVKKKFYQRSNAPDFNKMIPREQKRRGDRITVIPFSFPDYSIKFPSTIFNLETLMLVKYDKMYNKNDKRANSSKHRINNNFKENITYQYNGRLTEVANDGKKGPSFKLMTSRPDSKDCLPFYMKVIKNNIQNIFSRHSGNFITDKTLKMNNFSDGKFAKTIDTFWPKKSYNKIINLSLLNSEKFMENIINIKSNQNVNETIGDVNQYVDKSLKFYNKNFDDLMKESLLHRFDNVTYKSIKREAKKGPSDLERFLLNYENLN